MTAQFSQDQLHGNQMLPGLADSTAQLKQKALFLVWGPRRGSQRSEQIARELGIEIAYIYLTTKQGLLYAPFKYLYQGLATWVLLARRWPQIVLIQDPPIIGPLFVYLFGLLFGTKYIIDAHTEALEDSRWQWSLSLHRFLSRCAVSTVITNRGLSRKLSSWQVEFLVLPDPPLDLLSVKPMSLLLSPKELEVVMVCIGDYDEPVAEMTEAARKLPDINFYITGNCAGIYPEVVRQAPPNVHFTGYIRQEFYPLLKAADLVVCLTKTNHTFLSGANEALWMGKPLITSNWPNLKDYFNQGTLHIDNSPSGLEQALNQMRQNLPYYQSGILELQKQRAPEWHQKVEALVDLIKQHII
jgi:glycosyltransferase involved in cell wall biosynthesis